ncbi:2-amino-4-hydroxy-6-hydroxymethyldihydropteridine diphosphokinase [Paenibacillus sp. 1001270B_150601_E10]|uniref:2-amino-4-hydroxy-6- hydroxymethyldihydropteridine diphosphokinase n=1 Tax=Paenibacillus sp. 1001270B_150601_E10 TaxID=2787079 RepID=UPI0018A107FB|nr:2-amino-4-hydroxy-6-hydroxymethyldihydropteridine diphosphokinase [Paenibacillus sp. 1001270B_150601_E10]
MATSRTAYVALGSNLGEREQYLKKALELLEDHAEITVVRISSIYETDPVGYEVQPAFLNMTACLRTTLDPEELLQVLLHTEQLLGRVRHVRWGPRTIDLDLLWMEQLCWESESLLLPHPRMGERLFVLVPLSEIVLQSETELYEFVKECLGKLEGKEGIRLWNRLESTSEFVPSASFED